MYSKYFKVSNGETDVCASHPTFNWNWHQRTQLGPAMFQGEVFISVKRPTIRSRLETIFYPYNLTSWIVIVISFIAILSAGIMCDRALGHVYHDRGIFHNFVLTLSALINDSSSRKMALGNISASKTFIISFWLPASMMLSLAYQSNLLASLIRTDFEPSVDTFQDVLDKSLFKVYVPKFTAVPSLMKNSPNPLIRQTYFQAVEKNGGLVNGFPRGLPLIEMMEDKAGMVLNPYTLAGFGHLIQKGEHLSLDRPLSGYYFPVNFPLKDIINYQILFLLESGIYQHLIGWEMWRKRRMEIWYEKYSFNVEQDREYVAMITGNTGDQEELTIEHLAAVMLILVGGLGLSSAAFAFEARQRICRNMLETELLTI